MHTNIAEPDIQSAKTWAAFYRARGWNVLPSRTDKKQPLVRYSQWWDEKCPIDLFEKHPSPSLQVMTGRRWRLLVIDLDGPEATERWLTLGRCPDTWVTHSGGNGKHLWFRLPEGYPEPLPKAVLWKGEGSHTAIERLCDRSLIMAPPSIHPKTGRKYRFASKAQSPIRLPTPAACPGWVLQLKPIEAERAPYVATVKRTPRLVLAGRFNASDVLEAIHDKLGLASSWGLRIASHNPNHAGWCQCHAIGREDRTPSASISPSTGNYWEPGERTISLFDLGVRLGVYQSWRDAMSDLGRTYGAWERN